MIQTKVTEVEGLRQSLLLLRFAGKKIADGVEVGIIKAALLLQRESQRLVPVETGNLKASAFTSVEGTGFSTKATVGFTAAYALYVHEAVGMVLKGVRRPSGLGKYWDPQPPAQAKFLEEPSRRMAPQMLRIIRDAAKLKPL